MVGGVARLAMGDVWEEYVTELTRRDALAWAAGGALAVAGCAATTEAAAPAGPGLKTLAADKGLKFGTAISSRQLNDPRYVEIVRRECSVIVPENEFKMYVIEPRPGPLNFERADAIAQFARAEGLGLRGHTLLWNKIRWLPQWVNDTEFESAAAAEASLGAYIEAVASRYADDVYSWDVINETVDDQTGELRQTSYARAMGPALIDFCFHKAKEAAPDATLVYNDYMSWETGNENHRNGVLRLLEGMLSRGVPVDALGVQSHSNFDMPDEFTPEKQRVWRVFCDEVAGMGLEMYLTEFDVNDTDLGPDPAMRDRLIASYVKDYLDIMLSYSQVKDVLMWGMVDKDSWLQTFLPRADDVEKRPTPYDSNYRPKLMRDAIAAAIAAAPDRRSA